MNKIKVSEIFRSLQGEGRFMGVPSVFLRTFGCNFKCKNFGRSRDPIQGHNPEVAAIIRDLDKYKSYTDLPLVTTGCDSYAAVYPEFKRFSPTMSIDDVVESMLHLLPGRAWRDEHLVITGGEPLLGWQRSYPELLEHPDMRDLKNITFETNGTQPLTTEFKEYLDKWQFGDASLGQREVTFSVSAKLPASGESWADAIQPEVVVEYCEYGVTYLKFVVATEEDAVDADKAVDIYRSAGFTGPVYLMPVGGVDSVYNLNNRRVAELALNRGYYYSDRLQVVLWKNAWNT
jgi:organic radical activating enzyme